MGTFMEQPSQDFINEFAVPIEFVGMRCFRTTDICASCIVGFELLLLLLLFVSLFLTILHTLPIQIFLFNRLLLSCGFITQSFNSNSCIFLIWNLLALLVPSKFRIDSL